MKNIEDLGIQTKLISMINITLEEIKNRVRLNSNISDKFIVKEDLRQRHSLSFLLCVLEFVGRRTNIN